MVVKMYSPKKSYHSCFIFAVEGPVLVKVTNNPKSNSKPYPQMQPSADYIREHQRTTTAYAF